jgi:hypothetical protein
MMNMDDLQVFLQEIHKSRLKPRSPKGSSWSRLGRQRFPAGPEDGRERKNDADVPENEEYRIGSKKPVGSKEEKDEKTWPAAKSEMWRTIQEPRK